MLVIAKSDLSTSNATHTSYLYRIGDLCFLFTHLLSLHRRQGLDPSSTTSLLSSSSSDCAAFATEHGLGIRAVDVVEVEDANITFHTNVAPRRQVAFPASRTRRSRRHCLKSTSTATSSVNRAWQWLFLIPNSVCLPSIDGHSSGFLLLLFYWAGRPYSQRSSSGFLAYCIACVDFKTR